MCLHTLRGRFERRRYTFLSTEKYRARVSSGWVQSDGYQIERRKERRRLSRGRVNFQQKIIRDPSARPERDGARRGQKIFQQKNIWDVEFGLTKPKLSLGESPRLRKLVFPFIFAIIKHNYVR
jgi:hypothetical protein